MRWDATETAERGAWQHSLSATHRALREDKRTVQNLQVLERHTHGNTDSAWVVLWPSNVEQTDHHRGELPGPILNNCQGVGIVAQWLVIPLVMPASYVGTVLVLAAPGPGQLPAIALGGGWRVVQVLGAPLLITYV